MRKLSWLVHLSLDGFISGPNGELDWAGASMDDELWKHITELLADVDTALFGRVTYQDFENYWPAAGRNPNSDQNEINFARWIDETPKIVASRTLNRPDRSNLAWRNSTVLSGNLLEDVSKLKKKSGRNLLLFGSPGLASELLQANLIDELRIDLHPILLGAGRPLLKDGNPRLDLRLRQAVMFRSGVVGLTYVRC
jgi:dihydrofolate reductase